jgi:hypothetical protein
MTANPPEQGTRNQEPGTPNSTALYRTTPSNSTYVIAIR